MHEIATRDRPRAERHHAGRAVARVRPCPRACHRDRRRQIAAIFVCCLPKPGCTARSPGFLFVRFVYPAGGIGIRACLRNMKFRVRIPGGVPDFCGGERASAPLRQCDWKKRIVLLQLGMWQDQGRYSSTGTARRCQRRETSSRLVVCPIWFPSSKGQDSGPSIRGCRFNSGREHHGDVAQRTEYSPCKRMIWV